MSAVPAAKTLRDPRIDVLRGLALAMIFVDHIPTDVLNTVTMHNFGFCDAAEVFVLLAGMSSMLAYGKVFQRDGALSGLRQIAVRCGRIYIFQLSLMLATICILLVWSHLDHFTPKIIAPILGRPMAALAHGLTLRALPEYLDILPLYIVLLASFPAIYAGISKSPVIALCGSAGVWLAANVFPSLDLPNWMDGQGWYFNPFAWQFLFTIGAVLAVIMGKHRGDLPASVSGWWFAAAFLVFAFVQSFPWHDWHLPDLNLFAMAPPEKSTLAPLRIFDILALMYPLFSAPGVRRLAHSVWLRPVEACGRHSLEVFSVGCLLALFGRLEFHTAGQTVLQEVLVNLIGFGTMGLVGLWLDGGVGRPTRTAVSTKCRRCEPALLGPR
jgi:hypothetical protein